MLVNHETIESFTCGICGHPEAGLGPGPLLPFKALYPNLAGRILRMRQCCSCKKSLWREDHYWEVLQEEVVIGYECCECRGKFIT